MKEVKSLYLVFFMFMILSLSFVYADNTLTIDNQNRLEFNHILYITNLTTSPENIAPGQNFSLSFVLTNKGSQFARDIVTQLTLPSEITTFKDTSSSKIIQLNPDEFVKLNFNLIARPDTAEGIYNLPIAITYVNYVGEERFENETLGISIGSIPNPLMSIKTSDIYQGNDIGKITLNVINGNLANMKFVTVTLLNSNDFTIIGPNLAYIGDLNSDDTQSVDFRIKVKDDLTSANVPVILSYKDALNHDYVLQENLTLNISTAKELGIAKSNYGWIFAIVIVLGIVGYYYYQKKKKEQLAKAKLALSKR